MLDTQHASPEDLMLYANGVLIGEAAESLASHLDHCDECCLAVMLHRELHDLETLGVLPPLDPDTLKLPAQPKSAAPRSSKGPGIGKTLGGILAGLGLAETFGHSPITALGHSSGDPLQDHSGDVVRNDPPHSSVTGEGHHFEGGGHMASSGFSEATHHYGMPAAGGTSDYVHQGYPDTCAVQCQHLILDSFGIQVSEEQLMKEAQTKGIYAPGAGTNLEDVGKLLEAHGVPVHREMNANVINLATELSHGHQVIVGLDSGELWHENSVLESLADRFGIGQADHAVIVSGIDTTDPDHIKVVVTDPGTGDVAKEYALQEFLDAWKTSHFSMVATSEPVPSWHPEMVNFDYQTGHLPAIGAAPYDFTHELNTVAGHETDQGLVHNLESVFMSVVHGDVSVSDLFQGLGHSGGLDHHGTLSGLVSELLSLGQAGILTGAVAALLEPAETSGVPAFGHDGRDPMHHDDPTGMSHHDAVADHEPGQHYDTAHDSEPADADHHHDDPTDPLGWHHND